MAFIYRRVCTRHVCLIVYAGFFLGVLALVYKTQNLVQKADSFLRKQLTDAVSDDGPDPLEEQFLQRLAEMKINRNSLNNSTCTSKSAGPCYDASCGMAFAPPLQRLRNLLDSQYPVPPQALSVIRAMADSLPAAGERVDITFIVGASQNHFRETEGTLRDLYGLVLPYLRNHTQYTHRVVFYDLGLSAAQLHTLEKYCDCSVIKFPFSLLPPVFANLPTCSWKTAIIKAHYGRSKFVVWMDASTRFRNGNISSILAQADRWGLFISRNYNMLPAHVAKPMLDYFHVPACLLSPFYELAGGFLVFKQDALTEKIVLDPWLACTFSPDCLCPGPECLRLRGPCKSKSGERYSLCHRYDQAAIAVLLATLFDYRASAIVGPRFPFAFDWGDKADFFPRDNATATR